MLPLLARASWPLRPETVGRFFCCAKWLRELCYLLPTMLHTYCPTIHQGYIHTIQNPWGGPRLMPRANIAPQTVGMVEYSTVEANGEVPTPAKSWIGRLFLASRSMQPRLRRRRWQRNGGFCPPTGTTARLVRAIAVELLVARCWKCKPSICMAARTVLAGT